MKSGRTGRRHTSAQHPLPFRSWGGRRPGAGRPKRKASGVSHQRRPPLSSRYPVHVTLRVRPEVGSLRRKKSFWVLHAAFVAACEMKGFRVCQFSIQDAHIHVLVEAKDRDCLSRGIQGLKIRMARQLNRALGRRGPVFADRYHEHILRTPREVRNALNYVLNNRLRHKPIRDGDWLLLVEDFCSSAGWFDGWRRRPSGRVRVTGPPPVASAKTWLLSEGWRRHGLLTPTYVPPKRT